MGGSAADIAPAAAPAVELAKVSLSFGTRSVLSNIDLSVAPAQVVTIIGPSGSGKSTLLRCINGLESPDSGTVRIFGQPIATQTSLLHARRRMGTIFQAFNLYSMRTVIENVTLAPRKVLKLSRRAAEELARQCLTRVGVAELASKYPFQISGGQQQRVAIARALAMGSEILLLDEPTSALDPQLVNSVLDLLQSLTAVGMTIVCASHDIGFARQLSNRVAFLSDGVVVEEGPPSRLLRHPRTERLRSFLARVSG
jgi:polar amino acid transport system ATP-binding protein